jgi:hypothetical protein
MYALIFLMTLAIVELAAFAVPVKHHIVYSGTPSHNPMNAPTLAHSSPSLQQHEPSVFSSLEWQANPSSDVGASPSSMPAKTRPKERNLLSVLERREMKTKRRSQNNRRYYERKKLGLTRPKRGPASAILDPSDSKFPEKAWRQVYDRERKRARKELEEKGRSESAGASSSTPSAYVPPHQPISSQITTPRLSAIFNEDNPYPVAKKWRKTTKSRSEMDPEELRLERERDRESYRRKKESDA